MEDLCKNIFYDGISVKIISYMLEINASVSVYLTCEKQLMIVPKWEKVYLWKLWKFQRNKTDSKLWKITLYYMHIYATACCVNLSICKYGYNLRNFFSFSEIHWNCEYFLFSANSKKCIFKFLTSFKFEKKVNFMLNIYFVKVIHAFEIF